MRKPGEKTAAEMRAALSGIRCFLLYEGEAFPMALLIGELSAQAD